MGMRKTHGVVARGYGWGWGGVTYKSFWSDGTDVVVIIRFYTCAKIHRMCTEKKGSFSV